MKGTRSCNLRCSYCHDWRSGPNQNMSFPVLARTIAAALGERSHNKIDFIWHGGETTLLPISFYERALFLQGQFRRPGQQVSNLIQTNATRLTEEWVEFLALNGFAVGVSLDGPPAIHDKERRFANGRPSSVAVLRGIQRLKSAGLPVSVLMVIDQEALNYGARAIFDFFVGSDIKAFGLLAATPANQPSAGPGTPTDHYVNPQQMSRFLADMYDCWIEHGDASVHIRELDGVLARLDRERSSFCTLGGQCLGEFFMVETNGDISHCDLFVGDSDYLLGSILTHDFASFRRSPAMQRLRQQNAQALRDMEKCCEFETCRGWCPHERYLSMRHNAGHRADCCGLLPLIQHIRGRRATRPSVQTGVS